MDMSFLFWLKSVPRTGILEFLTGLTRPAFGRNRGGANALIFCHMVALTGDFAQKLGPFSD
jgi:hypothetical protein